MGGFDERAVLRDTFTNPEILFTSEDGAWAITKKTWGTHSQGAGPMGNYSETSVSACHLVCKTSEKDDARDGGHTGTLEDASWFIGEEPECWWCYAPVPDEIQTLYTLYEYGKGDLNKYDHDLGPE